MEGNSAAEKVVRCIEDDWDFLIELAQNLVRIPSVNPKFQVDEGINREADVQQTVASHLEAAGMICDSYDVFPDRPNVYGYREGTHENSLIINGHIDVVPAGDLSAWSVDPFAADLHDGKIYSRGAYDMKSGVAAAVAAAKALHDRGIELEGRFEIHSVVDEESGGFGTKDLVERGRLSSAAIIAEPTQGEIMTSEGGLEWVRVTIRGRNAHAGWRYNDVSIRSLPRRTSMKQESMLRTLQPGSSSPSDGWSAIGAVGSRLTLYYRRESTRSTRASCKWGQGLAMKACQLSRGTPL